MAGKEVGKIKIGMYVDGDDLANSIDGELGKAEGKAAGRVGAFFKKMAVAGGAAIAATAAKSLFDFTGFERSMNEVFTLLPGISGKAMDDMTGQVKNFAKEFGVLPDQVVPALYQALSAGVPPDNVFDFLETAQKAAKGGVTELTTAVDGISSVVNAYGADVLSATQASDLMFTAVRLGKTNFEELSRSLFNVTPTTAALGVKFGDVTAALAAMTAQGVPTSVATTQLRQLFVELSKEGTATSKVFEGLAGKSFKEFIAAGGDTQGALQLLEEHAKTTGIGINDLFGSVEAGSAALALTGSGTDKFSDALAGMGESAGATEAAFDRMNTGIGPIFDRMRATVSVALLDIGEKLADLGMRAVPIVVGAWNILAGVFSNPVFQVVAAVIATALVPAFIMLTVQAAQTAVALTVSYAVMAAQSIAATATSVAQLAIQGAKWVWMGITALASAAQVALAWLIALGPIALVVAAVVAAAVLIVANWDWIKETVGNVVGAIGRFLSNLIGWVVDFVQEWGVLLLGPIGAMWKFRDEIWGVVQKVIEFFGRLLSGAIDKFGELVSFVDSIPGRILGALGDLGSLLYNAGLAVMRGLRDGIVAGFNAVKDFVGGIAGKIADLKGPLDYDKTLLTPAGKAIMGGLIAGLRAEEGRLVSQLSHITGMFEGFGPGTLDGPEFRGSSFTSPTHLPAPSRLSAEVEARAATGGVNEERLARLIAAELAANPGRAYVVTSDLHRAEHSGRRR